MVDHLQSHVTRWRQYTSHVKVRFTLLKMDVGSMRLQLHDAIHRPDPSVLMLRYCANLKA